MSVLIKFNKLMERLAKAEKYMDEPGLKGFKGKELEQAVKEREKYVPHYQRLMMEATKCSIELNKV